MLDDLNYNLLDSNLSNFKMLQEIMQLYQLTQIILHVVLNLQNQYLMFVLLPLRKKLFNKAWCISVKVIMV